MNRNQAEGLLKTATDNPEASFREGQWEAIDTLVNKKEKLLVVQHTGWGKSAVYFIGTKIFRDQDLGPTIIISPLLALMRNQIVAAERLGIVAETMNSTNPDTWDEVTEKMLSNQIDCLLISPERLSNDSFVDNVLMPIANRISLMVIDEAHCISDWGHDFRPDYRRIVNILRQLPPNVPVLGTTATANNRVVNDIREQLGDIQIQRGSLERESLALQAIELGDQPSRLAWLAQVIPNLDGTGIIYALTVRDTEQVAQWLNENGIEARAYHGSVDREGFADSNSYRIHLEGLLLRNEIKVLVATTALGMGYDKPDLGFVIHYQAPSSIVSYYQQVGRAGRGIEQALGVMMSGVEDQKIHEFFRRSAFPSEEHVYDILQALEDSDGLSVPELEQCTNLQKSQILKVVKLLSVERQAPIVKVGSKWRRTATSFEMDHDRITHLTEQRENEWAEVNDYITNQNCRMIFLRQSLDDSNTTECGRCENCLGEAIIDVPIEREIAHRAGIFLRQSEIRIVPKAQVAANAFDEYGFRGNLAQEIRAEEGRVLSRWGDGGWGKIVADGKHANYFGDDLVEAIGEMIERRWRPDPSPTWVTCVPSLNHPDLVPNFAQRVARRLGLPFIVAVTKTKNNEPQKLQQNRYHQCRNLDGAFEIVEPVSRDPVLLIDDVVDSGWTFTVIAALLREAGSGNVYPTALASSSVGS